MKLVANQLIVTVLFILILPSSLVLAYVASSPNYQMESDSVNIGGSEDSSSASYAIRDTVGEVGTGLSGSAAYNLHAGYRQVSGATISITSPGDITLSPAISGISGGSGTGSGAWTVTTNNSAGYSLYVKTTTAPALQAGGGTFSDYVPAGASPDFGWTVAANDSRFGFSPKGTDLVSRYLDNGSACATGALNTTGACWEGLSTSNALIAQSAAANNPSGVATTLNFKAEVGVDKAQPVGDYAATVVLTAITN